MNGVLEGRFWSLWLLALCACGGEVDLGKRTDSGPSQDPTGEPVPGDPFWVKTERVLDLSRLEIYGPIALAGDFLYVAGFLDTHEAGLFRCEKSDCERSWQHLPAVNESLIGLQTVEQRLAFVGNGDGAGNSLGSYALPDATDRQVAIAGIGGFTSGICRARFHRGFVYWPFLDDSAYYRCTAPSCAPGPKKMVNAWSETPVAIVGDSVFIESTGMIFRIADLGAGPVEQLLPDETLSITSAPIDSAMKTPAARWLAASNDEMLYATMGPPGCLGDCESMQVVRWPAKGGPRETLFEADEWIENLLVFDGEITWVQGSENMVTLASCRAEACAATLRHLGLLNRSQCRQLVAADDERLYWLAAGPKRGYPSAYPYASAIRSVKRLPAPTGD